MRTDLSGPLLGRRLLVLTAQANGATDGSLRDAEFLSELPLGLERLPLHLPGEVARVTGENDLNLAVRECSGTTDRAFHDRLLKLAQATLPALRAPHAGSQPSQAARSALASTAGAGRAPAWTARDGVIGWEAQATARRSRPRES